MTNEEKPQLPDFAVLDKANPDLLFHAVAITMARYFDNGKKPGAEHWQSDTRRYRRDMVTEVWMEWSTLAQTDAIFPWHDDYVAEVWVKFRKFTKAQKEIVFNAFCIPMPCRFDQPGE